MNLFGVTARATIQAVGTTAALVVALGVLYGIARVEFEPWWLKLVFAAVPGAFILSGIPWLLAGGDQGTHIEIREGNRQLSISHITWFSQALARLALVETMNRPAPLPPPKGTLGSGSPADPHNVIEEKAALPADVEVAATPPQIPPDAAHLR